MKEIHKIKFGVFYLAMVLSGMYLAYYLFSIVLSIMFAGFNLGIIINMNLVAVALFVYFYSQANKEKQLYLDYKE
ncbi:hypothetical protein [Campylobacter sp. MG1]|uniref:hypothetical protein n=1 Tax=Campylobacter sp. MG1 TaxID=2976332 RepID=UPI00226C9A08|nr:hypothetical protein [Campylobacter sp. MG1]